MPKIMLRMLLVVVLALVIAGAGDDAAHAFLMRMFTTTSVLVNAELAHRVADKCYAGDDDDRRRHQNCTVSTHNY